MLGDGGQRHVIRPSQFADRPLTTCDLAEDGAARGVGQRVEDRIEGGDTLFNHVVEYSAQQILCQPFG